MNLLTVFIVVLSLVAVLVAIRAALNSKPTAAIDLTVFVAALVAVDQLIKLLIVKSFGIAADSRRSFKTLKIGGFKIVSITHIRNDGAGWSILGGKTVFLIVFTAAIMAAIIVYLIVKRKSVSKLEAISLCLIIAGGVGNLIDRARMLIEGTDVFPGVIDYIKLDFIDFPVFNFADCCVTLGAALFCVSVFRSEVKLSKQKKAEAAQKTDESL